MERTGSRRAEPRAWLRSVVWLVGAGPHPQAGPSTVRVAEDLASRMDFSLSLVLYDLDGTATRTGLSRATVKRHVRYLRELGALVWVRHGSKRNLRLPGRAYTATATIYGAAVPPVYDEAMGHRLAGSGYHARVCGLTEAGREQAVVAARARAETKRKPKGNRAAGARGRSGREPHSLGRHPHSSPAGMTSSPPEKSPAPKKSERRTGGRRRLNRFGTRLRLAVQLIAHVTWLRGCSVRRIAWVARHVADAGWSVVDVLAWLYFRGGTAVGHVHRASGLLATLLAGAEAVLSTPEKRTSAVEDWRRSQEGMRRHRIGHVRHQREAFDGDWQAPTDPEVRQHVIEAYATAFRPAGDTAPDDDRVPEPQSTSIRWEDLDPVELAEGRALVERQLLAGDPSTVVNAVHLVGRPMAERLYGADLVHRAEQLTRLAHSPRTTLGQPSRPQH
ncbi:transcriptional regulator [Streptomyces sp. IBSNAI002]|uniref:transcriptional regulator n=1 Tax=Streptomyces sp. IBSNAI002 TaxID=3457500 RepID=UPI003FD157E2